MEIENKKKEKRELIHLGLWKGEGTGCFYTKFRAPRQYDKKKVKQLAEKAY